MKNTSINSLEKLFNDVELYNKIDFDVYKIEGDTASFDKDELGRLLLSLGFNAKRITTFCNKCKMNYPFEIEIDGNQIVHKMRHAIGFKLSTEYTVDLEDDDFNFGLEDTFDKKKIIGDQTFYFDYVFKCTNEPSLHVYKMFIALTKKGNTFSVTKIGQYPSMIDVHGFDFDKYKKQLESIYAYQDYRKAELCNSDGFSAGAYTYLRRVFEKMLNKYCEGLELEDDHTDTKIKACKDCFDKRVHKLLNKLYKILSKGIHQLDDEESANYYIYLRIVIEMQLEFMKETDDNEAQTKMLEQQLNDIVSKIE